MNSRQSGFTLIELVMVIVIIGILAATAIPKFIDLSAEAQQAAVDGIAGSLSSAAAINYAARSASASAGVAVSNCTNVAGALAGGSLANGTITAATVSSGASASCIVTLHGATQTFTAIGT